MTREVDDLVDLERYPLDRRSVARLREVIERSQADFLVSGVTVLPEFLRPAAVTEMAADVLSDGLGDAMRFEYTVACDRIPDSSPLKALYHWEPLREFVSHLVGEQAYRSADELGAMTVQIHENGDMQDWHYDMSDYTVMLHIVAPERGGALEYIPLPGAFIERGGGLPMRHRHMVKMLPTVPGTLVLHAGRRSRHRVTPVQGEIPRVSVHMAFNARPGQRLNAHVRRHLFGRED
ncbi:hypothetical protein ACFRAQ_06780 [Nocardia sp. NPDC056611]|uniref:HalD/BesD family halogenase n=1 Tax=unclassified Nocardia TaxID=2637762 RepID=UPI00366B434E